MFTGDVMLELQQNDKALQAYQSLQPFFPNSSYLKAQTARSFYNVRNFDESGQIFEDLRTADPYRLEDMDTYSNILYVLESKAELSRLAHSAVKVRCLCITAT